MRHLVIGRTACVGVLWLGAQLAYAETVTITPGKWRTVTETKMSVNPEPQMDTEVSCIEEGGFDPVKDMARSGVCQLADVAQTDESFDANMVCNGGPMKMTGEMHYEMTDTTFEGMFAFEMGDQFSMEGKVSGERIGDCD